MRKDWVDYDLSITLMSLLEYLKSERACGAIERDGERQVQERASCLSREPNEIWRRRVELCKPPKKSP